jgi:hypothetical protein
MDPVPAPEMVCDQPIVRNGGMWLVVVIEASGRLNAVATITTSRDPVSLRGGWRPRATSFMLTKFHANEFHADEFHAAELSP